VLAARTDNAHVATAPTSWAPAVEAASTGNLPKVQNGRNVGRGSVT